MKKKRDLENTLFSFLDVISCGFGAIVMLVLIYKFNPSENIESDDEDNEEYVIKISELQLINDKLKISKETYLGDIIISYNFIDKPKSQNNESFRKKLIKTFIHGFLHLLSFNHVRDADYKKMLKEEKFIYQSVISKLN